MTTILGAGFSVPGSGFVNSAPDDFSVSVNSCKSAFPESGPSPKNAPNPPACRPAPLVRNIPQRVFCNQPRACAFRFLRQPINPSAPMPVANSGSAAGSGVPMLRTKLSTAAASPTPIEGAVVADQQTPTNYVPQAKVTVTYDSPRCAWPRRPAVVGSDGTREHFLVRFPRVGSPEAMARPSIRKAQRAKRAQAQRAKRARISEDSRG